jgi:protein tyrosine phosphatase (PTP) superfamily phosphohydrolase (DUF442 family)
MPYQQTKSVARQAIALAIVIGLVIVGGLSALAAEVGMLVPATVGSIRNAHLLGTTLLCGQPSQADLEVAKQRGIQIVLTLREEGEVDWDEQRVAESLGLQFKRVAFTVPETLTDDVLTRARRVLREARSENQPLMLHCGSANRVGAIWMAYRVLDEGIAVEQAQREALGVGLRTEAFLQRVHDYIQRQ